MKIKSLLIGSAAAAVMTTGAQAADAIVFPDPEPAEYVRVCDVYGAGFFYIPGTETCLKIGGYVRFEVAATPGLGPHSGAVAPAALAQRLALGNFSGYNTLARFTPTFDVRTATEWGTLRAYAEIDFNHNSVAGQSTSVVAAFIDIGDNNFVRLGRSWSPYSGWIRGSGAYTLRGGGYHLRGVNQISYFFNTTNTTVPANRAGFGGFVSVQDPGTGNTIDAEAGLGYGWAGGWVRAAIYYDAWAPARAAIPVTTDGPAWGGKLGVGFDVGSVGLTLTALYSGDPQRVTNYNLGGASWGLVGGARFTVSPAVAINAGAEWYNRTAFTGPFSINWSATLGAQFQPFGNNSLQIIPEINYAKTYDTPGVLAAQDIWTGTLRFNRNF